MLRMLYARATGIGREGKSPLYFACAYNNYNNPHRSTRRVGSTSGFAGDFSACSAMDAENSETTASEPKTRGRPFRPGESGNPGGRPRAEIEVRELARQHGPAIIRRLLRLSRSKNERVAVAACQVLLDRGYGRAPQSLELTAKEGESLQSVAATTLAISRDDAVAAYRAMLPRAAGANWPPPKSATPTPSAPIDGERSEPAPEPARVRALPPPGDDRKAPATPTPPAEIAAQKAPETPRGALSEWLQLVEPRPIPELVAPLPNSPAALAEQRRMPAVQRGSRQIGLYGLERPSRGSRE